MTAPYRGRFLWYDLMTPDPDAAEPFYTEVVGWDAQPWGPEGEEGRYVMWMAGERGIGGRVRLPADGGAPPHWLAYVGVENLDEALARVESAGGAALMEPEDIPDVGRVAAIRDPQGAVIALYTPVDTPPDPDAPGDVGHFTWNELATTDAEAAIAFYTDLFGWEKESEFDMGDGWLYHMFKRPGASHGDIAIFRKPETMPAPMWVHYVRIDDLDEAADQVAELGGTVMNGPMEVPGGDRVAQCMDPQGAVFALHWRAG